MTGAPPASGAARPERPQAAPLPAPLDVTDADFAERVLAHGGLVVVDFWAEWCSPCTVMSAHVMLLAQAFGARLLVAALDVDENPETAERYQIMGLPTLLFLRDGVEVDRQVGLAPFEELRQKVETLLAA